MNKALLSSNKDDWCTPQAFFDELDREFHFDLDAAASLENAKCNTGHARGDSCYRILEATPAAVKEIEENYYIQETFKKINSIKKLNYKQACALRTVIDEIL